MSAKSITLPACFQADLPERLAAAGHGPEAVAALLALDAEMFGWHRRVVKGELPGRLIAELGLELELSQFSALTAVNRIVQGIGRDRPALATVGLLAEEMSIDPSRASRIASGLIAAGWLRRAAAQDDGRKAVLEFTDMARDVFARFREAKWAKMLSVFEGWSEDDIRDFARLFARYSEAVALVYHAEP